jgi:hypothetical protein
VASKLIWRDHVPVANGSQQRRGGRLWFDDQRSPDRRLGLSTHTEAGVVVLSFWQGDICTGTFRLTLRDAPTVIAALAAALTPESPVEAEGKLLEG